METIKYHPILFSTPMVQAKQEGRKTQTRRTKGLEIVNLIPDHWKFEYLGKHPTDEKNKSLYAFFTVKGTETWFYQKCPYSVGDVLWVRETFCESNKIVGDKYLYKEKVLRESSLRPKWKPSLFMPKHACRIFLKIKKIRVERLRDIFHSDARSEGVDFVEGINGNLYYNYLTLDYGCNELFSFMTLWQKINGEDSWEFNPWVFVYEFEQIEKPLDFI